MVGLDFPTTKKFNFLEIDPRTLPPFFSTISLASDLLIFLKAPVKILGRIRNDDLPKILNDHSIYISTSLYEGSPKTVLEAMSCALITIAYSAPGIDEIISNNENGFVVRPSPYIMNNVIDNLFNNEKKVDNIRHNSRRYVVENYSFNKIMKIQDNLYFN